MHQASAPLLPHACAVVALGAAAGWTPVAAQSGTGTAAARDAPAESLAAAEVDPNWRPPRTSWGHPSFEGVWTTDDLRSVPLNRSERFGTRATLTEAEFRERAQADAGGREAALRSGSFLRREWGVRSFGYTSLIVDPPNGRMPALTADGEALAATRTRGTFGSGPFEDFADFSLYDRCITRGVLGSILPVIYGNGVRITQQPNAVAITYEMIHDTRVIPLDGRKRLDDGVRQYLGSGRGRFDGDTLVIESGNFTDRTSLGVNGNGPPNSAAMRLTERFTRVDPDMIEYRVTVDDPVAYTAPFTLRLMLTTQPDYQIYEYSCHEGNGAVGNSLSGERVYERQVAEAVANGEPVPARATEHNQIIGDSLDEGLDEAFDINAGE